MKNIKQDNREINKEWLLMTDNQKKIYEILVDIVNKKMDTGWLPQKYWDSYPMLEKKYKGTGHCPINLRKVMVATYECNPLKFIKKYRSLI